MAFHYPRRTPSHPPGMAKDHTFSPFFCSRNSKIKSKGSNWWNRVETGKHRQRWIFPSYQGVQIKGLIFSCPSSSIPTSLIHLLCWIQLPNLDQTIPTLKLTFFLPYFLSSLLQKTFSTIQTLSRAFLQFLLCFFPVQKYSNHDLWVYKWL